MTAKDKFCSIIGSSLLLLAFFSSMTMCFKSNSLNELDYPMGLNGEFPHNCVILSEGRLRCWGANNYGQLGYGHTENIGDDEAPASVGSVDVGGRVIQVTVGWNHTCALLDTGRVHCWGRNDDGQLGYGHTENIGDDETPASVGNVDVGGRVIRVTAGSDHACALLDTGRVHCWGYYIGDDEVPASDVDTGTIVIQVANSRHYTCVLLDTNLIRCWGEEVPIGAEDIDLDLSSGVTIMQIATGMEHTCALLSTGSVRCWGKGRFGQLGYGSELDSLEGLDTYRGLPPNAAVDLDIGAKVVQITVGDYHTCALSDTGRVHCWGVNSNGQLGYGHTNIIGDDETPASAGSVNIGNKVVQIIATGGDELGHFEQRSYRGYTCALLVTGHVRCWGGNPDGQLGYGHTEDIGDDELPVNVGSVNVGEPVIKLWGDLLP